jgi:DNA-binding response OmpR family regulator
MFSPAQRILFVSHARLTLSLRRSMNAHGFAVIRARSPLEGLDQLTQSSFHVVVIDLMSPADPSVLIKRIRKVATFKAIPIIVVGEWGTGRCSLALSAGADAFEPAPVGAARLIDAIARLPKRHAAAAGKGR